MHPVIKTVTLMDVLLGEALIKQRVITQSQLDMALDIQKQSNNEYLSEILLRLGVSQEKINETLDCLRKKRKIGDILISLGLITYEDLKRVLKEQKELETLMGVKRPLGILLFQMGLTKHEDYMKALSKHFVLQIVSIEGRRISPSLQDVLGKKYVCAHRLVVLENDEQTIKIALGEPTLPLMQEIRRTIPPNKEIIFYLADPREIESVHKRMFAPFSVHYEKYQGLTRVTTK